MGLCLRPYRETCPSLLHTPTPQGQRKLPRHTRPALPTSLASLLEQTMAGRGSCAMKPAAPLESRTGASCCRAGTGSCSPLRGGQGAPRPDRARSSHRPVTGDLDPSGELGTGGGRRPATRTHSWPESSGCGKRIARTLAESRRASPPSWKEKSEF